MKYLYSGLLFSFLICMVALPAGAQLYARNTLKQNREKVQQNLLQNSITKNLSRSLTDSTEDNWQDAFSAMELLRHHSPWIDGRIDTAVARMYERSEIFQRALLELLYANYPQKYYSPVKFMLMQTSNNKLFCMSAAYMLLSKQAAEDINFLLVKTKQQMDIFPGDPMLLQLRYQLEQYSKTPQRPPLNDLLQPAYLPGNVLVYSFQRPRRDFPGLVMVRNAAGQFIIDSTGMYFALPQLARSITNLPPYVTNGNTPQGLFRMKGYDVSRSVFIGPTVNVQLTMPFERNAKHFFNNAAQADTNWDIERYKNLLPASWRNYFPMYQSYYAGKAGRTEIIIHGTTVNPAYYVSEPYYPLTPTMGCLTSKEIWDEQTGQRVQSDQQRLINALIKAGGAEGYCIVVELDDEDRPVLLADILPYLPRIAN